MRATLFFILRCAIALTLGLPAWAASTYSLPDLYSPAPGVARPFEPGVYVGVPNSVLAAAAARGSAGFDPTVSIPGTTKIVAASMVETTGTTTSGSNQLTVASAASFSAGHGITLGAVLRLKVTGGATTNGQILLRLQAWDYFVDVLAGDSAQTVANKIAAITWRGTSTSPVDTGSGWEIKLYSQCRATAPWNDLHWANPQGTGVTFAALGQMQSDNPAPSGIELMYYGQVFEVVSKSGNVITLDGNASASWSGLRVAHDDGAALAAMSAAIPENTKLTLPANLTVRTETTAFSLSGSNRTLDGNGIKIEPWGFGGGIGMSPASGDTALHAVATITGGKTKASSSIAVSSSSGYAVGDMVLLAFGNNYSQPVLGVTGYDVTPERGLDKAIRGAIVEITAIPDGTHLQFSPPLVDDFSAVTGLVSNAMAQVRNSGLENFWVDHANNRAVGAGSLYQTNQCWIHNGRVSNGRNYMPGIAKSRKSEFVNFFYDRMAGLGTNRQGLNAANATACLFMNCRVYGMAPLVEVNGYTSWCAFIYNTYIYSEQDGVSGAGADFNIHTPHSSHNYIAHSWCNGAFIPDGYFGSHASHWVVLRNHWDGSNGYNPAFAPTVINLKRFNRHIVLAGNQYLSSRLTWTGRGTRFGEPNIGNPSYSGTQTGNTWVDYARATTVVTGASLAGGILSTTSDVFIPRDGPDPNDDYQSSVFVVNGKYRYRCRGYIDARHATVVPIEQIEIPNDPNPTTFSGTANFTIWADKGGWQELDLDVEATTLKLVNSSAYDGVPTAEIEAMGGTDLMDSLDYAAKPQWWLDEETALGQTFAWPPFGPRAGNVYYRSESISAIPSGFRLAQGFPPRLQAALIGASGSTLTLQFNKTAYLGADGLSGLRVFNTIAPTTATLTSGSGTTQFMLALSRSVLESLQEQPKIDLTQPGDSVKDSNGNLLDSITNFSVNNSSLNLGSVTEKLSIPFADTTQDVAPLTYAALGDFVGVDQAMTANKLVCGVGSLGSASPGTGIKFAIYAVSASTATLLREGIGSASGPDRMVAANIEPIDLALGTYFVAIRTSDGGARLRGTGSGLAKGFFGNNEPDYFSAITSINLSSIAAMDKTVCVGIRGVVADTPTPTFTPGRLRYLRR